MPLAYTCCLIYPKLRRHLQSVGEPTAALVWDKILETAPPRFPYPVNAPEDLVRLRMVQFIKSREREALE